MVGNNKLTQEEIQKHIEDAAWEYLNPSQLNIWTGIEGALNFQQHVVKYYGGTYTKEDRERDEQKLIESKQTIFKL